MKKDLLKAEIDLKNMLDFCSMYENVLFVIGSFDPIVLGELCW